MHRLRTLVLMALLVALPTTGSGQQPAPYRGAELDKRVHAFLERHRGTWQDLNVPEVDGRVLHNLILKHKFTRALEIGTSTGHSAVWIAWALAKTGGRLITVEIDRQRHQTALANFREAGLESYIDARLGDAHEIVPVLSGPFDFVFSDADKDWYKTTSSPYGRRSSWTGASPRTTCRCPFACFRGFPLAWGEVPRNFWRM